MMKWEVCRRLFGSRLKGCGGLKKKHLSGLQVELAGFCMGHYFYLKEPLQDLGVKEIFKILDQCCVFLCVSAGQQTMPFFTNFLVLKSTGFLFS